MAPEDDYPAGWLTRLRRGIVSGVAVTGLAVLLAAIPTLIAWLAPGADTTSALSALKAASMVVVAGDHGGLVLNGTFVSMTPLLVTIVLGWLVANHAQRCDQTSGFVGYCLGYTAAMSFFAGWSRLGATHAPILRSAVAALCFVTLVGGLARYGAHGWHQLPIRWQSVVRAVTGSAMLYVLAASVLAMLALVWHSSQAADLQGQVATGASGLPVALIGIAATPNAALAVTGYLTGPGFQIGSDTSISAFSVSHGRLPVFPMLAALPNGDPAAVLGIALIVIVGLLAGWLSVRIVPGAESGSRWAHAGDLVLVSLGTGALLAVGGMLASGSLGEGKLAHVGVVSWQVLLSASGVMVVSTTVWAGVQRLRGSAVGLPELRVPDLTLSTRAQRKVSNSVASSVGSTAGRSVDRTGPDREGHSLDSAPPQSRSA